MTSVLLLLSVCFLAYSNGSNDNFKGVASLYGSGATNYRTALIWSTVTTLAGSLCALALAQTLLTKFSGKSLAPDALIQSMPFITAVAAGAGLTVILATRLGFPVSTTHALMGALTGASLLAAGTVNFAALGSGFILPLLISPVLSLLLAMIIYSLFNITKRRKAVSGLLCVCIETSPLLNSSSFQAEDGAIVLTQSPTITVDNQTACASRYAGIICGFSVNGIINCLHFLSAGAVCFARGLNDTPKITALLSVIAGYTLESKIVLVTLMIIIGGLVNARRIAETMSHKITSISHGQGFSANLTTALLVILASKLGMPVSTTHVAVGSLFGIGLINRQANYRIIGSIVLSWLLTLPVAALFAAIVYVLEID